MPTFPIDCLDCGATFHADDFLSACPPCGLVREEMSAELVAVTGVSAGWARWSVGAVLRRHHEEQGARVGA